MLQALHPADAHPVALAPLTARSVFATTALCTAGLGVWYVAILV